MVNTDVKEATIAYSKTLIRQTLTDNDNDVQLETVELKVSLLCPLTKNRIKVPGRSIKCNHFQCFDLESFVKMNRNSKNPKWKCPICDQPATIRNLVHDWYKLKPFA